MKSPLWGWWVQPSGTISINPAADPLLRYLQFCPHPKTILNELRAEMIIFHPSCTGPMINSCQFLQMKAIQKLHLHVPRRTHATWYHLTFCTVSPYHHEVLFPIPPQDSHPNTIRHHLKSLLPLPNHLSTFPQAGTNLFLADNKSIGMPQ